MAAYTYNNAQLPPKPMMKFQSPQTREKLPSSTQLCSPCCGKHASHVLSTMRSCIPSFCPVRGGFLVGSIDFHLWYLGNKHVFLPLFWESTFLPDFLTILTNSLYLHGTFLWDKSKINFPSVSRKIFTGRIINLPNYSLKRNNAFCRRKDKTEIQTIEKLCGLQQRHGTVFLPL